MKTKTIFLFVTLLSFVIVSSCSLPGLNGTPTATSSPTFTPSIKNTATAGATISETPSLTPIVTNTFIVGDLGWGTIYGKVTDATTGAPIVGATVTCWHYSYTSTALCNTNLLTDEEGKFVFTDIYFHDTDYIQLKVESTGYITQTINAKFFTTPWLIADFALVPAISTEPPQVMCTQPACRPYESLFCPQGDALAAVDMSAPRQPQSARRLYVPLARVRYIIVTEFVRAAVGQRAQHLRPHHKT